MITLCMDTSHVFLALSLMENGKVIAKVQKDCWKHQSEEIFPELQKLMDETGKVPEDIGEIVISKGPGSYTGVRIAMTIAKVFCTQKKIPLATVGTLQLYAGKKETVVVLDARGNRSYVCAFKNGKPAGELRVMPNDEAKAYCEGKEVVGNGSLIGRSDVWPDIAENFLALKDVYEYAPNPHTVVPVYMKSIESYLVKK